jgi:hypothetical protein
VEPRDEPWDVDFVVGEDQPADELLPEPPRRPPQRNPMVIIAAAVVLALSVIGVVRLAGGHAHRPVAAPAVHAPVVPNPQLRDREVRPVPGLREAAADTLPSGLRYCPPAGDGGSICSTSRNLPSSVQAALHAHLPAARNIHGFEEQLRDIGFGPGGLWFRDVHARLGSVTIRITVARRRIPQPEEVMILPQYVGFSFHRTGFYVRTLVHVHGPQLVPILRLMALTRDPRLRAAA